MKKGHFSGSSESSDSVVSEMIEDDHRRFSVLDDRRGSVLSDNVRSTSEVDGLHSTNFYQALIQKRRG